MLTDDLVPFERRKLHLLNGGHTMLAAAWRRDGAPAGRTVGEAMEYEPWRTMLEAVWADEVLPVFAAWGDGAAARRYVDEVRARFGNAFLDHRLADIAGNHAEKMRRRLLPVVEEAERLGLGLAQDRLRAALRDDAA